MQNLDKLLHRAMWETLSVQELEEVAKRIEAAKIKGDENLYTLIDILGRAGAIKYRSLVESFLFYPADSMVSSIALNTLCDFWGYDEDYKNKLKEFIRGVDWDENDFTKLRAISCSGELLREKPEKELFDLLIATYDGKYDDDEICREAAFSAIARGIGKNWDEIFSIESEGKFDPTVNEARKFSEKLPNTGKG